MASAFATTPFGGALAGAISKETDQELTLTADIRNGPVTLLGINLANSANTVVSCKVFNSTGEGYTQATTQPELIIPVELTAGDPKLVNVSILGGLKFANGISISASKEDGNDHSTAPDDALSWKIITQP